MELVIPENTPTMTAAVLNVCCISALVLNMVAGSPNTGIFTDKENAFMFALAQLLLEHVGSRDYGMCVKPENDITHEQAASLLKQAVPRMPDDAINIDSTNKARNMLIQLFGTNEYVEPTFGLLMPDIELIQNKCRSLWDDNDSKWRIVVNHANDIEKLGGDTKVLKDEKTVRIFYPSKPRAAAFLRGPAKDFAAMYGRLILAHELAHALLHANNKAYSLTQNHNHDPRMERACYYFARLFLEDRARLRWQDNPKKLQQARNEIKKMIEYMMSGFEIKHFNWIYKN